MSVKKQFIAALTSAFIVLQPLSISAAPGSLSQDPLFYWYQCATQYSIRCG